MVNKKDLQSIPVLFACRMQNESDSIFYTVIDRFPENNKWRARWAVLLKPQDHGEAQNKGDGKNIWHTTAGALN